MTSGYNELIQTKPGKVVFYMFQNNIVNHTNAMNYDILKLR